jgi:hypothetical protein
MTDDEQDGETMHDDQNVVAIRDEEAELDRKVCRLRLAGTGIGEIGRALKLSDRAVLRSLNRSLPELTSELRMRLYQEDLLRCDTLIGVWYEQARSGSAVATSLVVKLMERRASMVGSDSHTKIELIVPSAKEEPNNSTVALLEALNRIVEEGKPTVALELVASEPDPPAS